MNDQMVIWKYTIPVKARAVAQLIPENGTIVKFANQNEQLTMWIKFCPQLSVSGQPTKEQITKAITILQIMTGEPIPAFFSRTSPKYYDTILFDNGKYVVHVFAGGMP